MTDGLPLTHLDVLEIAHVVDLTVLDDMRLVIEPQEIARDAEHNSATFRIVQQPASLDQFVCRAEVETKEGTNYRLVEGGEFSLTNDIAVQGTNTLQLVYSDGGDIIRKTYKTPFHVSASINAIDPSEPEYENGLAQLQTAAFASVIGGDNSATFYNISGQPVGILMYPPGQGGGLDEATANTLYLRLDGANPMQASLGIMGPNRGITWDISGMQGAIYSNGTQLIMRRAVGETPIVMENNSGSPDTRSPILTEQMGDGRYITPDFANVTYARRDFAQFTGPVITTTGTSNTNPGIAIGDNATGFWRSGSFLILSVSGGMAAQWNSSEMFMGQRLNMATSPIWNLADPRDGTAGAMDAANRRYVDSAIASIPPPAVRVPAPVILREVQANIAVSQDGTWVPLTTPITFNNPRADATVLCVCCMVNATCQNVASANLRMLSGGTTLAERRGFIYGAQGNGGFTVMFFRSVAGPSVGPFSIEIQSVGAGSPAADFTVVGGIADGPRTQIAIYEVGPPS